MQHFLNSLYVLLVEPSSAQSKIITHQFDELGIQEYKTAETGAQALDLIDHEQPDLVISAMFLPDMTGKDLVYELRENPLTEDTPFMLISTVTSAAELEPIRQAGASAVLPKPFTASDLKRAIDSTLDWVNPDRIQLEDQEADKLRVLVVDDSRMARHMIIRTLEKMGLGNFDEAENGREAIPLIRSNRYDLIITDYHMPEMDGHELLVFIKHHSECPETPVLMVTTEGDQGKLKAIQHEGVAAILDKPFEVSSVKDYVESALSQV